MTRWNEIGWYRPQPRRPPPQHGIKMKTTGTTWWGQRWIEALAVVLLGDTGRLARGKSYAHAGRTHDLVIKGGEVTAKVTGSRPTPYRVTIEVAQLPAPAWIHALPAGTQPAVRQALRRGERRAEPRARLHVPRRRSRRPQRSGSSRGSAWRAAPATTCLR